MITISILDGGTDEAWRCPRRISCRRIVFRGRSGSVDRRRADLLHYRFLGGTRDSAKPSGRLASIA
jgi:hypothetical protein